MMPLPASMPYERAVSIARSAGDLEADQRERLVAYLVVWAPGLADRLLAQLVALEPELVATAMLDQNLPGPVPKGVPGPGSPADPPAEAADAWLYAYDPRGEPVLELIP